MKRPPTTRAWRRGTLAACLAMTACAAPAPAPLDTPAPAAASHPLQVAQLGHGRSAMFGWCPDADCPRRTPKTLAAAPTPAPQAATPSAPGIPVSTPDSLAKGEELLNGAARPARPAGPEPQEPAHATSVQFPFASAHLDAAGRAALHAIAPRLEQATEVRLSGRTDSTGPIATNERLAQARAEAVRRALLTLVPGIAPVLTVESQGACCFVESNDSAAGRARNRRVEIFYRFDRNDPP